jgi:hypothetical protein
MPLTSASHYRPGTQAHAFAADQDRAAALNLLMLDML